MNISYVKHELRNRPHRTMVNIIGIAIGIALFVAINAIADAYRQAVSQPFADIGADLVVQKPEQSQNGQAASGSMRGIKTPFSNQLLPGGRLKELAGIDGVSAASGSLLLWEFIQRGFRSVSGVDMSNPDLGPVKLSEWIAEGRSFANQGEAVVEKHFAKFHQIKIGNTIEVGGKPFAVVGTLEVKEGVQIAAANIFIQLADAQTLSPELRDSINVVYLRLANPGMQESVKRTINARHMELSVSSSNSFVEMMGGISLVSGWFSWMLTSIALAGAALLVLKSMSASLVERIQEIGVLKALGWTRRNIQAQLLGEAVVQCVIGGLIGIGVGFAGAYLAGMMSIPMASAWELNPLPASARAESAASQFVRLPVDFSWLLMLFALGFSVVIGCIAAYFLGKSVEKVKPSIILRKI